MTSLLARLLALSLLRCGPQDLPFDVRLLWRLLLAWGLLQMFAQYALFDGRGGALQLPLAAAFLILPIRGLLALRNRNERFVQTAIGFVGTSVLFGAVLLPVVLVLQGIDTARIEAEGVSPLQSLAMWTYLIFTAWKLAVDAHLWRQALDWPAPAAVAASLLLFIAEVAVLGALAGGPE